MDVCTKLILNLIILLILSRLNKNGKLFNIQPASVRYNKILDSFQFSFNQMLNTFMLYIVQK